MRILILSTSDIEGGAAIAARRLHQGLRNLGADSHMLVMRKKTDDVRVVPPSKLQKAVGFFHWQVEKTLTNSVRRGLTKTPFSNGLCDFQLNRRIQALQPDIVNFHWVNDGFVRIASLPQLNVPLVWSMHDMWAFTGGCHYDGGCGKYQTACGNCPQLGKSSWIDLSKRVFQLKEKAYSKSSITFVASSSWLANCADTSALLRRQPVETIHTGLNTSVFKPINTYHAREILNLPHDKKIVLFGSLHGETDIRKGFSYIFPSLEHLASHETELVVFGQSKPFNSPDTAFPIRYMGQFKDEPSLALLLSAADVLLFPSIQENFGNICMESLACGTPVVAFDIGGNGDMIVHRENGYLATPFDSLELGAGLQWVLDNPYRYEILSQNARQFALDTLDQNRMAQQYLQLFQKKLGINERQLSLETTV